MTVIENPQRLRSALMAVFCAEPIDAGRGLCPEVLGACPAHPVCGATDPLTSSARCLRRHCDGLHDIDGLDDWADTTTNGDDDD